MSRHLIDLTGRRSVLWGLALAAVLFVVAVPVVHAQDASTPPGEVIRLRNVAVKSAIDAAGDSIDDATREELKEVINGLIDFTELSKRALARHWDARTPDEQTEFTEVFRELIRNSSVQQLGIYSADSITYSPAATTDDGVLVRTIAHKDDSQVEIDYYMHQVDGEWRAYDVVIDDSSTLRTYRDSFQRQLSSNSYEAMYSRLVDRLERDRNRGG